MKSISLEIFFKNERNDFYNRKCLENSKKAIFKGKDKFLST